MNKDFLTQIIILAVFLVVSTTGIMFLFKKHIKRSVYARLIKQSFIPFLIACVGVFSAGRIGGSGGITIIAAMTFLCCSVFIFWRIHQEIIRPIKAVTENICSININEITSATRSMINLSTQDNSVQTEDMQFHPLEKNGNHEIENLIFAYNRISQEIREAQKALNQSLPNFLTYFSTNQANIDNWSNAVEDTAQLLSQTSKMSNQIIDNSRQITQLLQQQRTESERICSTTTEMRNSIDKISSSAEKQSNVIQNATDETSHMSGMIKGITQTTQLSLEKANKMAIMSEMGVETIKENLSTIENINLTFKTASENVAEMGRLSDQIGVIVDTIDDIASQTNLLALNAAIEAARTSGSAVQTSQKLLQNHLSSTVLLFSELLRKTEHPLSNYELVEIAKLTGLEDINITDADGVVTTSNQAANINFRFSDNPKEQSYEFRHLLYENEGLFVQEIRPRTADGRMFMYVGASRRDQPGMVQVGISAEEVQKHAMQGRGFAVVANEVRKLAGQSASAAKEIANMIKDVQRTIQNTTQAMKSSSHEIANGVTTANKSEAEMKAILFAANSLKELLVDISSSFLEMQTNTNTLFESINSVSLNVEENATTIQQLILTADNTSKGLDDIAKTSEKTNALTHEVNSNALALTEKMESALYINHRLQDITSQMHYPRE
jgi:methyl-accepting chemotaxis protein